MQGRAETQCSTKPVIRYRTGSVLAGSFVLAVGLAPAAAESVADFYKRQDGHRDCRLRRRRRLRHQYAAPGAPHVTAYSGGAAHHRAEHARGKRHRRTQSHLYDCSARRHRVLRRDQQHAVRSAFRRTGGALRRVSAQLARQPEQADECLPRLESLAVQVARRRDAEENAGVGDRRHRLALVPAPLVQWRRRNAVRCHQRLQFSRARCWRSPAARSTASAPTTRP